MFHPGHIHCTAAMPSVLVFWQRHRPWGCKCVGVALLVASITLEIYRRAIICRNTGLFIRVASILDDFTFDLWRAG